MNYFHVFYIFDSSFLLYLTNYRIFYLIDEIKKEIQVISIWEPAKAWTWSLNIKFVTCVQSWKTYYQATRAKNTQNDKNKSRKSNSFKTSNFTWQRRFSTRTSIFSLTRNSNPNSCGTRISRNAMWWMCSVG